MRQTKRSRSPRDADLPAARSFRHQGIYGYKRDLLLRFVRWKTSPLERAESLEQLRALENGVRIKVVMTESGSPGVDTPEDARSDRARVIGFRRARRSSGTQATESDEVHFYYRRSGEFVRQGPGGRLPWHAARAARLARRVPKVRPVPERRSGNDESVPAWRGLCAQ